MLIQVHKQPAKSDKTKASKGKQKTTSSKKPKTRSAASPKKPVQPKKKKTTKSKVGDAEAAGAAAKSKVGDAEAAAATAKSKQVASVCTTFRAQEIDKLAKARDIKNLRFLAMMAETKLKELPEPSQGWRSKMPLWKARKTTDGKQGRGLTEWIKDKSFCHSWLQDAVTFYAETIGMPPVITGVKPIKKTKKRKRSGHTRGQLFLVQAKGRKHIDFKSVFIIVVAAHYCLKAKPVVEDGTEASNAVLAVLLQPSTLKVVLSTVCYMDMSYQYIIHIYHVVMSYLTSYIYVIHVIHTQMKSRLQRWGNKRAILACVDPLYEWISAGDKDLQLKCIRNLGLDEDTVLPKGEKQTVEELVQQCCELVVEFFLAFSSGKVKPGELNKKGDSITKRQKPYSNYAGQETSYFKNVSPACFGITLATTYPFLAEDRDMWSRRCQMAAHPCTALWSVNVVKRFLHFIDTLYQKLPSVFEKYEEAGGQYYDAEDEDPSNEDEHGSRDDEDDEEEDDCDNVFA